METPDFNKMLPEVWFDWYARLIPGCVGITLYYWFLSLPFHFKVEEIFLFIFLGYIIGHIIQPLSSKVVTLIPGKKLEPRTDRLTSKAYSELISMCSCFFVTIIVLIWGISKTESIPDKKYFVIALLLLYFLVGTWLRADATDKKVKSFEAQQNNLQPKSPEAVEK
jgi:hypothetical protein